MSKWILTEREFNIKNMGNYESLMYQGNGYMGIRNSFEEKYVKSNRATVINGVFNIPSGEVPEISVLPDTTNFDISIDGYDFSLLIGELNGYKRELDLTNGESRREVLWTTPDGKNVSLKFNRIVSDVKKHIFAQKVAVEAQDDMEIVFLSGIDGKVTNSGVSHFGVTALKHYGDKTIGWTSQTLQSGVKVGVCSAFSCNINTPFEIVTDRRGIYFKFTLNLKKGESTVIEKISSYATSRDFEYTKKEIENVSDDCFNYLSEAKKMGYDALLSESADSWEAFWKENGININAENDLYERALNFSLYHLKIMASGRDNRLGIGAKALSGEGYKGHSFWDTEIFILPFYIFNAPQSARKLLEYRYRLLETARKKAEKYGFLGAMYPWESAWLDDGETCPEFGDIDIETGERRRLPMSTDEVHIGADIVYGVWLYFMATNDVDFMEKCGYEIILLTALFWTSKVTKRNGRYEILNVIGPDEYKEGVDNNAYTNYMAHFNMELALDFIETGDEKIKQKLNEKYDLADIKNRILSVKDKLYLPVADENGIIPQFDGFSDLKPIDISGYRESSELFRILSDYPFEEINNMQVCKQADNVMLFYTLKDRFSNEEIKKNFEYYEARTLHDSSLSMCMHSVVASYMGDKLMAEKLYRDCCVVDYGEENNNSSAGIHAAAVGGIWIATVMGFCGLRVNDNGLHINPALPDGIKGIDFPFKYKNSSYRVKVTADNCNIERISGKAEKIILNGETKTV